MGNSGGFVQPQRGLCDLAEPGGCPAYNFRQIHSSLACSAGPNKPGIVAEPGAAAKKTTPKNPNTCREEYFPGACSLPGQVAKRRQLRERRFFPFEPRLQADPSSRGRCWGRLWWQSPSGQGSSRAVSLILEFPCSGIIVPIPEFSLCTCHLTALAEQWFGVEGPWLLDLGGFCLPGSCATRDGNPSSLS